MATIVNPITGEKIEIAKKDFPSHMTWDEAKKACSDLGEGWRLPTYDELKKMCLMQNRIGGFKGWCYWGTGVNDYGGYAGLYFHRGGVISHNERFYKGSVRAVRTI